MTAIWAMFLEVFQVGLFGLTQFYGGHLASAIVAFSLLARLVLLPLTVRMTLRARDHARRVKVLKPELARVRERWKENPERRMKETLAVYERRGIRPVDTGILKGSLLQTPIFIGLYNAVRGALSAQSGQQSFLWVSNLARPDIGIAMIVFGLVGLSSLSGASQSQPGWTLALPAVISAVMSMTLSAGFGLYLAANGAVGTLQGLMVRRAEARSLGHAV